MNPMEHLTLKEKCQGVCYQSKFAALCPPDKIETRKVHCYIRVAMTAISATGYHDQPCLRQYSDPVIQGMLLDTYPCS